ncbi:MAG: metallophosphoesterase, partial [Candidatus Micrarchaeota archaeon]|nr:metallophosphoesterase [Candidatus Micrarchaeota archaeon]
IANGIEALEGLPVLYIEELSAIVCSDLHLGYEGVMADRGTFLPKVNLRNIKKTIKKAIEMTNAERIIIDGDIKNEFSNVHVEEFNEFYEFTKFLREELKLKQIDLIKGNHDNFIDRYEKSSNIKLYRQEASMNGFLFFHGEELPHDKEARFLVMGHLHPAIGVYNKLGIKEKLKCFLYGKMEDGREIVILPAMNYFAEGVDVAMRDLGENSPIFAKMLDVGGMEAICIGEDELLDFGKVSEIAAIGRR